MLEHPKHPPGSATGWVDRHRINHHEQQVCLSCLPFKNQVWGPGSYLRRCRRTPLPPSMYVPQNDQQYKGVGNIPDPDSDVVSNAVSSESGMSSPHGGSQVNVNENTLEKGIDGDIRRAARNIKKQIAGQESQAGAKGGVQAPLDPNLICPSCGLQFRIGEIQKFKRHASTCVGT